MKQFIITAVTHSIEQEQSIMGSNSNFLLFVVCYRINYQHDNPELNDTP